jgi:hypothetical protein
VVVVVWLGRNPYRQRSRKAEAGWPGAKPAAGTTERRLEVDVFVAVPASWQCAATKTNPCQKRWCGGLSRAGRLTAGASNVQPWYFIVVRDAH